MNDYYRSCAIPKPRPRLLEKREQKAALAAQDRAERKLCKIRSGGQCEVITAHFKSERSEIFYTRCRKAANQNHHLMGGHGRRNVGPSILAEHRLDVCNVCHAEINAAVLVPLFYDPAYQFNAALVRYERME